MFWRDEPGFLQERALWAETCLTSSEIFAVDLKLEEPVSVTETCGKFFSDMGVRDGAIFIVSVNYISERWDVIFHTKIIQ